MRPQAPLGSWRSQPGRVSAIGLSGQMLGRGGVFTAPPTPGDPAPGVWSPARARWNLQTWDTSEKLTRRTNRGAALPVMGFHRLAGQLQHTPFPTPPLILPKVSEAVLCINGQSPAGFSENQKTRNGENGGHTEPLAAGDQTAGRWEQ